MAPGSGLPPGESGSDLPVRVLRHGEANLAFVHSAGTSPTIMFMTGFRSDMTGSKALELEAWARRVGSAFVRFDYQGHGQSSGQFTDGTITGWVNDAVTILDQVVTGPVILIGSSMGGWLAGLVALSRPERMAGLVGIAAAPDFTEELIWDRLPLRHRTQLMETGSLEVPSGYADEPYVITRTLILDGRRHLLLRRLAPLPIRCPVRLIHGQQDIDVPWMMSVRFAERIVAQDVVVTVVKDGEHRLSRPEDLTRLCETVHELQRRAV